MFMERIDRRNFVARNYSWIALRARTKYPEIMIRAFGEHERAAAD